MFASLCQYLLVFIYLLSLARTGLSIHCYSCDTIDDHEACEDPFNITLFQPVMCLNDNFACIKEIKFDNDLNRTFLHRGCVQKHHCERFAKSTEPCSTCTYDFCNSTAAIQPFTIIIFLIIAFICMRLNLKNCNESLNS